MIRHTTLFQWTAAATAEQKQAVAAELTAFAPTVPAVRSYWCGADAGLVEGNFDFAVVADFDDEAGYFSYRDHPVHREISARTVVPIMAQRVSVQFRF
jgi:stress responsive alpha/beta barrel protein